VDPLALLCNLHAEGPATLRVLHRAGIRTLANVIATADWALAELLGSSPSAGRRFAREAEHLARSARADRLEPEEGADAFRCA
jgi:hypothetical protein